MTAADIKPPEAIVFAEAQFLLNPPAAEAPSRAPWERARKTIERLAGESQAAPEGRLIYMANHRRAHSEQDKNNALPQR